MTYQTPWHRKERDPGAYGHIRINEIVASLPLPELEEYERLQNIKPKKRTSEQQARMEELWNLASEIHRAPGGRGWRRQHPEPPDPWYEQIVEAIWERVAGPNRKVGTFRVLEGGREQAG